MNIQSSLSSKNPYRISRHRFLELRHFCLQYKDFKKRYLVVEKTIALRSSEDEFSDPTGDTASYLAELSNAMKLIETASKEADPYLAPFIFRSVTEGISFDEMAAKELIYCGRNMFYDRYRKFFYILDLMKGL